MKTFAIAIFIVTLLPNLKTYAKLGETLPQLIHRFGSHYKTVPAEDNETLYEFSVGTFDVDVAVNHGVSVSECYYSFKPLVNDRAPEEVVKAILKTNVPDKKWIEKGPHHKADDTYETEGGAFFAVVFIASQMGTQFPNPEATFAVNVHVANRSAMWRTVDP
jgi:hypothetical protein